MADFVNEFWSWWVTALSLIGLVFCFVLLRWMNTDRPSGDGEVKTMGHVWDGDLEEYNNPLPSWWLGMFYITLIFGLGYFVLYPGLGSFQGVLGWSSKDGENSEYAQEVQAADAKYGPLFEKYAGLSVKALGAEPEALKMGGRLFQTYCTQCHGSDAGGVTGFPNLRDNDWLWGGTPEAIEQTIAHGRQGAMPAWEVPLGGEEGVKDVANYVMSLSERKVDEASAARGKEKFVLCVGCHGPEGKGNPILGAPNLTDNTWLYGGSPRAIRRSIAGGRSGKMPAHNEFLGPAKVHLLAAYIYSLSGHSE